MPYYVYAIHLDDTNNRPLQAKPFDDYVEAAAHERKMSDACFPHDNYRVTMLRAESDAETDAKADAMRPFPKLQTKK